MKRNKKKILLTFTNFFAIIFLLLSVVGIYYTINTLANTPSLFLEDLTTKETSKIYDYKDNLITSLEKEDVGYVTYDDLPDCFINALISTEDVRFFLHNGIDLPRLYKALQTNFTEGRFAEGASTLTQQLIKNTMLSSSKTLKRKIEEMYLAHKLENLYSKKEIIEFYANYICFDGINAGVNKASYKFFNKKINSVTLPEAALLVGIINLPTYYNPFKNPINATNRRNTVLDLMVKHNYIFDYEADMAKSIPLDQMLFESNYDDTTTYPYQAYLDIVIEQIKEETGLDPYVTPMKIYTYMDSTLQAEIDLMQQNKSSYFTFQNDLQQMAATVIDNNTGAIIAAFGGRNYQGRRIFNRAYDMLKQPASTIKPILSYALAFEYLNWSNQHCLLDNAYYYPNSTKEVNNVDYIHMGELMIDEAIGYSRNTTAVKTLEEVINKVGSKTVTDYLEKIKILDVEANNFVYPYALGAFEYGVSPTNLAAAYSMIANYGIYKTPLSVRKIELLDGSNKVMSFNIEEERVLSEESCFLLTSVLESVMSKNFWNIQAVKPNNINVVAKTGTSSFEDYIISQNNYPKNSYKDRWLAGYSKDITIAVWTGFDKTMKDENTYFIPSSGEANIIKSFFKRIMDITAKDNLKFSIPNNIVGVNIVKGSNYLLPTENIDKNFVVYAHFKKGFEPHDYITEPNLEKIVEFDYFMIKNLLTLYVIQDNLVEDENYNKIFDYEKYYGGSEIICEIVYKNEVISSFVMDENIKTISLPQSGNYKISMYYKYKNGTNKGPLSTKNIRYKSNDIFDFI